MTASQLSRDPHSPSPFTPPHVEVRNNDRNVQLLLSALRLNVTWSVNIGPDPPAPATNISAPAADSVTLLVT